MALQVVLPAEALGAIGVRADEWLFVAVAAKMGLHVVDAIVRKDLAAAGEGTDCILLLSIARDSPSS